MSLDCIKREEFLALKEEVERLDRAMQEARRSCIHFTKQIEILNETITKLTGRALR